MSKVSFVLVLCDSFTTHRIELAVSCDDQHVKELKIKTVAKIFEAWAEDVTGVSAIVEKQDLDVAANNAMGRNWFRLEGWLVDIYCLRSE